MSSKASHADWRQAVRSATGPTPVPQPAPTLAPSQEERKAPLGTYIPEPMLLRMRELSLKLTREHGRRVTISDIVTEALRQFLEQHQG